MSTVIQQVVAGGTIYSAVFSGNSHVTDMVHRCMVYTERAEMAADSCGISHASAVSTPLRWIFKNALKKLAAHVESHASAMSLLESGE